ncbi:LOW QUALITY PROTEIN: lutropin subunit beta-like [Ciconia boyciana]|uniref:LOW QUALITY PROTEIN: lutropin subunit beta-like n=1 Tax=Ciconia boyciana TaxID=52775 RepID=UPI003BA35297
MVEKTDFLVLVLVTLMGTPMSLGIPIAMGGPIAVGDHMVVGSPMALGGPMVVGGPGRPPCRPINVTVAVEKDECPQCLAVTTTAAGGLTKSAEPVYRSPLGAPSQAACTYFGVRYGRWVLGGCPSTRTDPGVTVPVALGCRCGRCSVATADCTVAGLGPAFCGAPGGFGGQ